MGLEDHERKHNRIMRRFGAECAVLLKKDGHFPLSASSDIALYGNGARNTIKGGTGSGEVNSRFYVTVEKGLERAGFRVITGEWLDRYDEVAAAAKEEFLENIKKEAKENHADVINFAMGRIMTEPEYEIPINAECKTAIYVLSRISGEGSDRSGVKGDILLTDTEKRDIAICNEKYENFMLVLNTGGVVDISELGYVKNILILSQLGVKIGDTFADIVLGRSNPSGKLATTWTAWDKYPRIGSFGEKDDTEYKEGIYVGYRYFDTVGEKQLYPFGFGLSYSSFEIEKPEISIARDVVTVETVVRNTGAFTGKEVVQVYVSVPDGKLDQPYQVLAGFGKTDEILPGENEKVSVSFSMKDIASYSTEDAAYILEPGDYILRVGNDSINTVKAGAVKVEKELVVKKVKNLFDKPQFNDWKPEKKIGYDDDIWNLEGLKIVTLSPASISEVSINYERSAEIDESLRELPMKEVINLTLGHYNSKNGLSAIVGNAGFTVAGAAGQTAMGFEDKGIPTLCMADGPAGIRISKHYTKDDKGVHVVGDSALLESVRELMPKPVSKILSMSSRPKKGAEIYHQYATAIPIGTAIAQSFNVELAEACGDIVGEEMEMFGVQLWLAPALNIHRDIRCGRNFEYYSEDPLISGLMSAAITKGVQKHKGCGVTIKHFAANNQEYNRFQNNSVLSERTLRDIYLKGFEICIRDAAPKAVMTSYNLVNGVHTSHSSVLTEDVLRTEFGHEGIIMTDWVVRAAGADDTCKYDIAHAPDVIDAGGDLFMPGSKADYDDIHDAIKKGKLSEEKVLQSATRVVKMAKLLGEIKKEEAE